MRTYSRTPSLLFLLATIGAPGCGIVGGGDGGVDVANPLTDPEDGPPAGNQDGGCSIPAEAGLADVSSPTTVVGDGTPASCTADATIDAIAGGGVITFDCGPEPVVITLDRPARIFNDTGPEIVIDGGGLVTLSGGGTDPHPVHEHLRRKPGLDHAGCANNQDHPRLTVQNLTFVDGNASDEGEEEFDGGGAIWARGGPA